MMTMFSCYKILHNNIYNFSRIFQNTSFRLRNISTTPVSKGNSYDGDGKSTVHILNSDTWETGLLINGYSQVGFRLSNNVTVLGPMAIFPRSVLSWNIENHNDINDETLKLFTMLEPKLDLIVIGIGDPQNDNQMQQRLLPFSRKHNLNLEILSTEQACSTFNFLNSEGRCIAGVLIPPTTVKTTEDDVLRTKLRYQNLYEVEE